MEGTKMTRSLSSLLITLLSITMILIVSCGGAQLTITTTPTTSTPLTTNSTTEPPTVTKTISPTTSKELVPKSVNYSQPGSSEGALEIIIQPQDENGQLLNVEGWLSVTLWAIDENSSKGEIIQQWPKFWFTKSTFIENYGNQMGLLYMDFVPDLGEIAFIQLTLTVGNANVTTEGLVSLYDQLC
ncbi:hypothetical protein ACFLYS_00755 [Chloroflexota bacterium]